jgi:hypothetical protein
VRMPAHQRHADRHRHDGDHRAAAGAAVTSARSTRARSPRPAPRIGAGTD